MLPVTSVYAATLALLFLSLSARVLIYERSYNTGMIHGGQKGLVKRKRARSNCAEYAPIGIVLLALCEMQGTPSIAMQALGLTLLIGRICHAIGFSTQPSVFVLRQFGMALTVMMIAMSATGLLLHSFF